MGSKLEYLIIIRFSDPLDLLSSEMIELREQISFFLSLFLSGLGMILQFWIKKLISFLRKEVSSMITNKNSEENSTVEDSSKIRNLLNSIPQDWGLDIGSIVYEEGLDKMIDLCLILSQELDRKVLFKRNDDHLDTDFHTENMIQKVIKVPYSVPKKLLGKWEIELRKFFESLMEVLVQVRQDLKQSTNKDSSKWMSRRLKRLQSILRQGKDPTIPEKE